MPPLGEELAPLVYSGNTYLRLLGIAVNLLFIQGRGNFFFICPKNLSKIEKIQNGKFHGNCCEC